MSSSVVFRTASSKAKLGAAVKASCGSAIACIQRRLAQERQRAHDHGVHTAADGAADAQHQAHVVVEGQPRSPAWCSGVGHPPCWANMSVIS